MQSGKVPEYRKPLLPAGFPSAVAKVLLLCFSRSAAGSTSQRHHGNLEHQLHPEVGLGPELEPGRELHSRIRWVCVADRHVAAETFAEVSGC